MPSLKKGPHKKGDYRKMCKSEWAIFFRRWLANPLRLGAVFPSSKALSHAMAKEALALTCEEDFIIEIGAGTGRFTEALLDAGVPPQRLICIEIDPQLGRYVQEKFPMVQVIVGDACHLSSLLPQEYHGKINVIVSAIPMISLPKAIGEQIISQCLSILKPSGTFLQMTYNLFSSISSSTFHLNKRRVAFVFRNFPPATVWAYNRKAA